MVKKVKKEVITKNEMISVRNAITNEMETAKLTMIVQRDTPKYKGEPFTMMFQAVNKAVARNVKPATAKLLLYLCSEVAYGNIVSKGIPEMAKDLGYSDRQVHRAMVELEELKVVIKSKNPSDNRLTMYHINPHHSWKGTVRDRSKQISIVPKNQLDIFGQLPEQKERILKPDKSFE